MHRYVFETDKPITCCIECPVLSYDSKVCGLAWCMNHPQANRMLEHELGLLRNKPEWCPLKPLSSGGSGFVVRG